MTLTPEELDSINKYFSSYPRNPGASPQGGDILAQILEGAKGLSSKNTSVPELLEMEYFKTGQLPEAGSFVPSAPASSPVGLPGDPQPGDPNFDFSQQGRADRRPGDPGLDYLTPDLSAPTGTNARRNVAPPVDETIPTGRRPVLGPEELQAISEFASGGVSSSVPAASSSSEGEPHNPADFELAGKMPEDRAIGPGGIPEVAPKHYFESLAADRLQGQIERQRHTAERLTGNPVDDEPKMGTVGRIFDILQRPNFAMASGVGAVQEGMKDDEGNILDSIGDFAKGAWQGLTGKNKETFSDVLEDAGVENDVVRGVAGFVLDVALDPLTYVGAGIVKKGAQEVAEAAGAKATSAALADPAIRKTAEELVEKRVISDSLGRLGPKGATKASSSATKNITEESVQRMVDREVRDYAIELGKNTQKALETKGAVEFKFAGKKFGQSEALYSGVSKAFKPIREMPPVKALNVMFRPRAELGAMHGITRLHEGVSVGKFEDHLKYFREITADITEDQAKAISHAIEGTRILDKTKDARLLEVKEHVERLFKNMWDDEVAAGLHAADAVPRSNYLYHVLDVGRERAKQYKTTAHKRGAADFTKERVYPTLEQAMKDGMKPIEDVREIVFHRAAKHYKELTHHSIMMDGIENFGIKAGTKAARTTQAALKGRGIALEEVTYKTARDTHKALFPEPIARALNDMQTLAAKDKAAETIIRHFDKIQHNMKFALTVANPGHHIRNMMGDIYLGYQDGVRNPKRYTDALKAVRGMESKFGSEAAEIASKTMVRIGDGTSSLDEISQLYKATGSKSGFYDLEVGRTGFGKASSLIRKVSTGREDTARMAHFIDVLKKDKPKNWSSMNFEQKRQFAMNAAERVKKFHFDYGDLSSFEKGTMRRLAMFYTFSRKNFPLQLEMLMLRPGKIVRVPQANDAISTILGVDTSARDNPKFEGRIPQWIRDMNAPMVGQGGNLIQKLFADGTSDPIFANPQLPTSDLGRIQGPTGIARQVISELRPELKVPIEAAFGIQAFSGAPTNDAAQTFAQQTPITNLVRKFIEAKFDPEKETPWNDLVSWLSGISVQRVTPQRQQSELRRQQQPLQETIRDERTKESEEFLRRIREQRQG